MTTYINLVKQDVSKLSDRRDKLVTSIKGYNSNLSTYMFQSLIESQKITFANASIQTLLLLILRRSVLRPPSMRRRAGKTLGALTPNI
jgi:hypothetical protein